MDVKPSALPFRQRDEHNWEIMKILISSVPLMGHLNPVVSLARLLVEEGHEVVGLSTTAFRPRVEASGAQFRVLPPAADLDLRDFTAAYPEFLSIPPGPAMTRFYFERVFADPMMDQFEGIQAVLKEFPADVIITDNLFLGVLPLLLGPRQNRPAIIYCSTTYLLYHREDAAPCNLGLLPSKKNAYADIATQVNREFTQPFSQHLNGLLAKAGLPALEANLLDAVVELPDMHLQLTVPGFEYPRPDMPSTVRFIGATPITPGQAPIPAWGAELDGTRKVVFVTQGTLSNFDFNQLVRPALDALADRDDILVVVTAGGRAPEEIPGPLPANARVASYLPFEWLLPKVDVLVTNGGYGTVNQALSFGIPIVGAGQSEDKAEVNARIAWSGVGIDLQTNNPDAAQIGHAVRSILSDQRYSMRAKEFSSAYRSIDVRSELRSLLSEVTSAETQTQPPN